jgi:hypothetical protein
LNALGVPHNVTEFFIDISDHKEVDIVAGSFRKPALTLDDFDSACIVGADIEIKVIFY